MACKCRGSGTALTQRQLSPFIQEGGCGPKNPLIPAIANGEGYGSGLRVTGATVNTAGSRSTLYSLDEFGNIVSCGTSEDAPDDNGITLEWASCGCGGFNIAELQQCSFDVIVGEFCCGGSRLDISNSSGSIRFTEVKPNGYSFSDLASFNAEDNERITLTQNAIMGDIEISRDLEISNVVGNLTDDNIYGFAYVNGENCTSSANCNDSTYECGQVWYAMTSGGDLIANTPNLGTFIAGAGFPVGVIGSNHIAYHNNKVYAIFQNVLYVIDADDQFSLDIANSLIVTLPFSPQGIKSCGQYLYVWGFNTVGSYVGLLNPDGSVDDIWARDDGIQVNDLDCCGGDIYFGGNAGFMAQANVCGSGEQFAASPTFTAIQTVAIREGNEVWYSGTDGTVWWTDNNNITITPSLSTSVVGGRFQGLTWATPCVGYAGFYAGSQGGVTIHSTVDGGATWNNNRIEGLLPGGLPFDNNITVPCCTSRNQISTQVSIRMSSGLYQTQLENCS